MNILYSFNETIISAQKAERVLGKERFERSVHAAMKAYLEERRSLSVFFVGNDAVTITITDSTLPLEKERNDYI